jgi:hypothetical protein
MLVCTLKRLFIGTALVMLASLTPAYSQVPATFGKGTAGTIASSGLSGEMKRASRFTLGTTGTVTELCAYLDGNGGVIGTQRMRLALYRDSSGAPGAKVFETKELSIANNTSARWFCMNAPLYPVAAGTYWIAIHTGGTPGIIRDYYDGPPNWYGNTDSFDDGAASSFGAGNAGTGTLSVFAQYFASSDVRTAGRTTIGTAPSGGMATDMKRGSSFTLSEPGKLYGITAYLYGNGSGTSNTVQQFRYVIYNDANGVPGAKRYESRLLDLRHGAPGSWFPDIAENAPFLEAGRYWIVIHTGPTGNVIRNFADGSGNWYGNADVFEDGASSPFGAGNAGNGTISAFISYRPGTFTQDRLGRTDIATAPSSGLSANFTRWSRFQLNDDAQALTGLHAYLDGRGATSGSQTVRMAIYQLTTVHGGSWYAKVAESQDVTIAAGLSPRWVDFAVPATPLSPGLYLIAIQTGDTAGVVRDYGDNRPDPSGNWGSVADPFADGAAGTVAAEEWTPAPGSVTLSAYASYLLPQ